MLFGFILLALSAGGPAKAATALAKTLPSSAFAGAAGLEPILVGRKRKARKRRRLRRAAKRRRHNAKQQSSKTHGKPKKPKPAKHKKPAKLKLALVCIGGRVKARKCKCPGPAKRHKIGRRIFGCRGAGTPAFLPAALAAQPGPNSSATAPSPRPAQAALRRPQFAAAQVLVMLTRSAKLSAVDDIAKAYGLEFADHWPLGSFGARLVRFHIRDGQSVAQAITALRNDPRVLAPQPNYFYHLQTASRNGQTPDLQYALEKVEIARAHALARGRGVKIAILDSGIDATHPDLAGAVAASWPADGKQASAPGDHGTAIAGIIRARGQIRGVAPEAQVLDVNVFRASGNAAPARATTLDLLRGIDWALSQKARIFNISLAGPRDPLLRFALQHVVEAGAFIVAAAGNGGLSAPPAYPAAYAEAIAVTATDQADRLYSAANRGTYIALAAPGVDILSPASGHAHLLQTGTSFAAAHVSGIIALMLSRTPRLSARGLRQALTKGAGDLGPPGPDTSFGAGGVNAFKSLILATQSAQTKGQIQ